MDFWPVLVQSAAIVVWGATLTQRVKTLEEKVLAANGHGTDLATIKTKLEGFERQFEDFVIEWREARAGMAKRR